MNSCFFKITFCVVIVLSFLGSPFASHASITNSNKGKIALVTGASRGIGFSLTQQLLNNGLQVIAVARGTKNLQDLKKRFPNQLQIISADLSTKEGQLSIAPVIGSQKIDYLVHNAAIINPLGDKALLEASPKEIQDIFEVNVIAPMILTNQLAPNLKKGSRILLISSRAGDKVSSGIGFYCITKVAIDRYAESLKLDKPNGVLATSVHPGDVDTDMQADLRNKDRSFFSRSNFFRKAHEKLISPETSGRFLKWLLLDTSDDVFIAKKHSIMDKTYYPDWNNGVSIIDPLK